MIKVKSYFSDDVIDTIDYSGNLGCFFDGINPDWRLLKGVNASLFLNGDPVFLFELDSITLKDSDSFEIYIDPKGGIVSGIGKLLGGVLGFAFGFLLPSSRSTNHNRVNTPQGQRLEVSDIKANQPRLGAVVPEGFGRYRRYMDNVTEIRRYFVDKRQQEVEALLCVGVGDYLVENMKVGDTDISAMDNTEYFQFAPNQDVGRFAEVWHTVKEVGATSNGTAGLSIDKYLKQDTETPPEEVGIPEYTNSFIATPEGVLTDEIEVDFFFPNGLCYVHDEGYLLFASATLEVEVKDNVTGSVVLNHKVTYTEITMDQVGFSERIKLPSMIRPVVRVRKAGFSGVSIQLHDDVVWFGLKAKLLVVSRYKNWTTIGITMQSGGKLSAQSETSINAIITRKLPELQPDGSWSEPRPTRDIASCVRYIAHEIGYTDSNIDMTEVLYLHNNFWKPRNETFDYIFDETTVKSAIETAFNAGLSDLTVANGKIKPVRDDVRTDIEQSYSAQNIIGNITQSFKTKDSGRFDGVELEYVDDSTFDKKVITCSLPNSEKKKLRKVSLRGVTSELRAWRIGMRLASEDRYINKDFSFKTEMDAFNSEYGSYIAIIDDVPNYGQSSQILEVGSDYIVISEDPNPDSTVLAWRDRFGKYHGDYPINKIEGRKIYVNLPIKPLISLNFELPHAYLGNSDRISHRCVVDEILPNSTQDATIKASIYDERVYAYDNSEII